MKYDFTTLPDRHGRDSIAVDGLGKGFAPDAPQPGFDAIPMWRLSRAIRRNLPGRDFRCSRPLR